MASAMLIFSKVAEISAYLNEAHANSKSTGFVPTMGALHRGHLSLIQLSKNQCDLTICSIFVNPTQFNDKKDLESYPRMPEKDILLLEAANCDVLFLPLVSEIYPRPKTESFDFGLLNTTLEGQFRPGHFNGVAQVVKRFFEIIRPTKAFFGSKDYQQVMIVKALVAQMNLQIEIVACPILREEDGLAMSSRNALLNSEERIIAAHIPDILKKADAVVKSSGIEAAKVFVKKEISKVELMRLDYYEVCDADTLTIVNSISDHRNYVGLIACFVGRIRLIDNRPL
jgi:pantoate--beta-alanine ligase